MRAHSNPIFAATPHILIVGGGFAGLWATRAMAKDKVRITLVDRQNHHLFQPLLYQVATAGLSSNDIAAPLRHLLRKQKNVEVRLGTAIGIDLNKQQVVLADDAPLHYDYLVLASGATHAYFGCDEWAEHAPGLKTLDDALNIRRRLLLAFERAEACTDPEARAAWMHFAVVGGGPTGVELAGTLAEISQHTLRSEFRHIDPAQAEVRLIEAGSRILPSFPDSLSEKARVQLEHLGVEVLTGTPVADITANGYRLGDQTVTAHTVLWAAGVAASPLGAMLNVPLDRAGRVLVQPDLSVPGHPEILVAGDLASLTQDEKPVPGVAPAAKQMGKQVARTLRARMQQQPAPDFRYRDFGNLATIGRLSAVVDVHGFKLSGVFAWLCWLFIHIMFLIGFRSRLIVLINWSWAYWSYQRGARIILGIDRDT